MCFRRWHVSRIQGRHFCKKQRAPAAAGKTSTELIHVMKSQQRHFLSAFAPNLCGEVFPAAAGASFFAKMTFLGFYDTY